MNYEKNKQHKKMENKYDMLVPMVVEQSAQGEELTIFIPAYLRNGSFS